jgi:hypothetical protein
MPTDTSFALTWWMTQQWLLQSTWWYSIDSHHDTIKVYSFNIDKSNLYQPLTDVDLYHPYLHRDGCSAANDLVCKNIPYNYANYIKEYQFDSMKANGIIGSKKGAHIRFTSNGEMSIHFWFKRIVLEYLMPNWFGYSLATNFEICHFGHSTIHWATHLRISISPQMISK